MAFLYVIDGSNVSRSGNGKQVDLRVLYAILTQILKNGDNFMCFFDANFPYLVSEIARPKVRALSKNYPDHFYFVSASTRADDAILGYVDAVMKNPEKYNHQQPRIISRDTFASEREYKEQYPWLSNLRQFVISVNRMQDVINISHEDLRLNIDLDPNKKIKTYGDELFALLPKSIKKPTSEPPQTPPPQTNTEPTPVQLAGEFSFDPDIANTTPSTPSRSDILFAKLREATRNPERFRQKNSLDD